MSKVDILFIEPNSSFGSYQGLADRFAAKEPGTWSLLLANSCRAKGYEVGLLDCSVDRLSEEEATLKIREYNPRLVVMVVYGQNPNSGTTNMAGAYKLAGFLKSNYPEYKIGFVGSHTSALPQEVLSETFTDFVFVGDGVYTLHNLLKTDLENYLDKVKGLGWKKDGIPQLNPPEIVVPQERLEFDLPGMALDLIDIKKYRAYNWHCNFIEENRTPFISLYTSLGCVKKCSFCMINAINRSGFADGYSAKDTAFMRFWNPDFILKELEKIANLGIKNLRYSDELFVISKKHYEPILKGIIDRGLDFNSWVYCRVDSLKSDLLPLFKKAGVNWYAFGVEASSQEIRIKDIEKGHFQNVNVRDVIKQTQNAGINVISNYIFGFEHDNFQTMNETLDLALELNTEMANFYPAMALPASQLNIEAKKKGYALPTSFEGYSFLGYETLPLPTKFLTAAEVLAFRDKAWQTYFTNPKYLSLVEGKFGVSARKHVEDMSKVQLKRRLLE